MYDADVLIAGGGPVGLATAIEARRRGYSVIVAEPRDGPIDKVCGEGLMPGALTALHELGVDPAGWERVGISYRDSARHVEHRFRSGPGRGVRRTVLHRALHERAAGLGSEFLPVRVDHLSQDADGVSAAGVRVRWLLACDGLHSKVRRLAGLAVASQAANGAVGPVPQGPVQEGRKAAGRGLVGGGSVGRGSARGDRPARRFGLRRHFRIAPWTDFVEVHWGRGVEAYVTPVADDEVGVALLGPPGVGYSRQLTCFEELWGRLRSAEPASRVSGAGPLRQNSRRRVAGRVRLVGDASGYVDALTGEGLRVGFAQARAAVATLEDGPQAYERAWRAATRDYRVLTSGLVRWASSPARGAIVPAASALPGLYGAVVDRLAH